MEKSMKEPNAGILACDNKQVLEAIKRFKGEFPIGEFPENQHTKVIVRDTDNNIIAATPWDSSKHRKICNRTQFNECVTALSQNNLF